MKDYWIISDWHLGHKNILNFKSEDGSPVRPGFTDVEEMNETIVERHNAVVSDSDHVYFLGDAFFGDGHKHLGRFKGKKRLILGNHDDPKDERLMKHFQKVMVWRHFIEWNCLLTHIPLMPESFRYKVEYNVHGHIHQQASPSPMHINACVEWHNYTPVLLSTLMKDKLK